MIKCFIVTFIVIDNLLTLYKYKDDDKQNKAGQISTKS